MASCRDELPRFLALNRLALPPPRERLLGLVGNWGLGQSSGVRGLGLGLGFRVQGFRV